MDVGRSSWSRIHPCSRSTKPIPLPSGAVVVLDAASFDIAKLTWCVFHGTAETHRLDHPDALARVDAVMTQAANVQPAGALFRYARVPVKQGICHHFANEGQRTW